MHRIITARLRVAVPVTGLVGLLALSGCGVGAGKTPADVQLRVSDDAGQRTLLERPHATVKGEDTVMRVLQRNATVQTSSAGKFVSAIQGVTGAEDSAGNAWAWFYFDNGVASTKGAADVHVATGDRIWWDRRDYRYSNVNAVVGSFPAPFRVGDRDATPTVQVACAAPDSRACTVVAQRLHAAGITARTGPLTPTAKPTALRVLVGPWTAVRADPIAVRLEQGPKASGVFARPTRAGTLRPVDRHGKTGRPLRGGWGLIAATRKGSEPPTWTVTGADDADVQAAAGKLREADLAGHFALLIDGGTAQPLPLPETP